MYYKYLRVTERGYELIVVWANHWRIRAKLARPCANNVAVQ